MPHLLYNHFFYLPPFPKNTKSLRQLSSFNGGVLCLEEAFSFMKNTGIEIESNFMLSETASMFLEHDNDTKIKAKLNKNFYSKYP